MSTFTLSNFFSTTLAAAATTSQTTLTVASTTYLPSSVPSGDYFPVILKDQATGLVYEIVYCTAISGSTLTVIRAQEGTTAQAWSVGDYCYSGPTAETLTTGFANLNGSSANVFAAANGVSGNDVLNFDNFSALQSLVASGYQEFPGGLILQWVEVSYTGGTSVASYTASGTLPMTFPTGVLGYSQPAPSAAYSSSWTQLSITSVSVSTTTASFTVSSTNGTAYTTNSQTFRMLVVGY